MAYGPSPDRGIDDWRSVKLGMVASGESGAFALASDRHDGAALSLMLIAGR
jgi:hypothetical protein